MMMKTIYSIDDGKFPVLFGDIDDLVVLLFYCCYYSDGDDVVVELIPTPDDDCLPFWPVLLMVLIDDRALFH